jgi:hypothetical protein
LHLLIRLHPFFFFFVFLAQEFEVGCIKLLVLFRLLQLFLHLDHYGSGLLLLQGLVQQPVVHAHTPPDGTGSQ